MSDHILDSNMRVIAAALRAGDTTSAALVDEAERRHDAYGAALEAYNIGTRRGRAARPKPLTHSSRPATTPVS